MNADSGFMDVDLAIANTIPGSLNPSFLLMKLSKLYSSGLVFSNSVFAYAESSLVLTEVPSDLIIELLFCSANPSLTLVEECRLF